MSKYESEKNKFGNSELSKTAKNGNNMLIIPQITLGFFPVMIREN